MQNGRSLRAPETGFGKYAAEPGTAFSPQAGESSVPVMPRGRAAARAWLVPPARPSAAGQGGRHGHAMRPPDDQRTGGQTRN